MKLLFALRSIFLLPHFFVFKLCENTMFYARILKVGENFVLKKTIAVIHTYFSI